MSSDTTIEHLNTTIDEISELITDSSEKGDFVNVDQLKEKQNVAQDSSIYREDGIDKSHILEDKEANALTMKIKIENISLEDRLATQVLESFAQMPLSNDRLLTNLMYITQQNPPRSDEKIDQYFVRLANDNLIEIDDTIDNFINLFET
jgi:hypothetical protein